MNFIVNNNLYFQPGYYDINYQTPTSLSAAGVRENLGSVAYSTMSDARFARTDNNSSPVSTNYLRIFTKLNKKNTFRACFIFPCRFLVLYLNRLDQGGLC